MLLMVIPAADTGSLTIAVGMAKSVPRANTV